MAEQDQPPAAPLSMNDTGTAMHEMYMSYRRGGFGRWEALWLLACVIKGVPLPGWLEDQLKNAE